MTPVLSYYLLRPKAERRIRRDGPVLRFLKFLATPFIRLSMNPTGLTLILSCVILAIVASSVAVARMGRELMPEFNEGAIQVNLITRPGVSLDASRQISQMADREFSKLLATDENPNGPLRWFTCKTGRAEDDEHTMGVHLSLIHI